MPAAIKTLNRLITVGLLAGCGFLGYEFYESTQVRERLARIQVAHDELKETFNEVVRRTAVTELVVKDGKLRAAIRNARGEIESIPTPFDPAKEIYVDYLVINGRLWIRRIFDQATPPEEGVVMDPNLGDIDWQKNGAKEGKAVYRALEDGRWIISVTGDGSLGLTRLGDNETAELTSGPDVGDYQPLDE